MTGLELKYRKFEAENEKMAKTLKELVRKTGVASFTLVDGITVSVGPIPKAASAAVSEIAESFGASLLEVV
jgi:hypothetical protein